MDFQLDAEQRAFADAVGRFAREQLSPGARRRAHSPTWDFEAAQRVAAQGLMGIALGEADGGQGGTLMHAVLAIEQVALACPRSADIVQVGNFGPLRTFAEYATAEQKARFLPGLLAGRQLISLGMSEPEAGSAVTELQTHARQEGEDFIVNGTKVYSSHSLEADLFLVYVRFGPGVQGIGSVLLERGMAGFSIGQPTTFMNGEAWGQLYFENVRVPARNLLLGPGGFKKQIAGFNVERLGNAARALACGRYCFNQAREHALQRRQFGRTLAEFQGIQWKFAEMALKLEQAQLMLYKAALEGEHGLPSAQSTAMAKLACNLAGWEVANESLQVMGGLGFTQDLLLEYCVRRTRGWMIAGGSVEILKNRIAEGVFGRSFSQRPDKPVASGGSPPAPASPRADS